MSEEVELMLLADARSLESEVGRMTKTVAATTARNLMRSPMSEWIRIRNTSGQGRDHRYGHRRCLDAYNEAVDCGIDRGDCGDRTCCFSTVYNVEASNVARDLRVGGKP